MDDAGHPWKIAFHHGKDLETRAVAKHPVENDGVDQVIREDLAGGGDSVGEEYPVTGAGQMHPTSFGQLAIVIREEDGVVPLAGEVWIHDGWFNERHPRGCSSSRVR